MNEYKYTLTITAPTELVADQAAAEAMSLINHELDEPGVSAWIGDAQ